MRQVIVNTLTLDLPDVVMAFTNHWVDVGDSGTATHIVVTGEGIAITATLHSQSARFSLLPFIRQHQQKAMLGTSGVSPWSDTIAVNYKAYHANSLLASVNDTITYIFGSGDGSLHFTGEKHITYNPYAGGLLSVLTQSVADPLPPAPVTQNISITYPDSGLVGTDHINCSGDLRNINLASILAASFTRAKIVVSNTYARGIKGNDYDTSEGLVVWVTRDNRSCNITALRWLDLQGCEWTRAFGMGDDEQSVSTDQSYAEAETNRAYDSGYDAGSRIWCNKTASQSITIGDDSIPVEQLPWIKGLLASSCVDIKTDDGWQRVNIADASLSVNVQMHRFSVSIKVELPQLGGQQW